MRLNFLSHAGSRVADAEHYIVARNSTSMCSHIVLIKDNMVSCDGKFAAVWHGIAGIDDQIHQNLPHVAGIGLETAGMLAENNRHFDVLVNESPQHFVQFLDLIVKIKHHGFHGLLATEHQQLSRQRRRAFRCLPDFFGEFV